MTRFAKLLAPLLAAAVLAAPYQAAAAEGTATERLSALEGVEATPLTAAEADAIHGALSGQDLYDALVARANLIRDPALRQRTLTYLSDNQARLVAYFDRLLALFRR